MYLCMCTWIYAGFPIRSISSSEMASENGPFCDFFAFYACNSSRSFQRTETKLVSCESPRILVCSGPIIFPMRSISSSEMAYESYFAISLYLILGWIIKFWNTETLYTIEGLLLCVLRNCRPHWWLIMNYFSAVWLPGLIFLIASYYWWDYFTICMGNANSACKLLSSWLNDPPLYVELLVKSVHLKAIMHLQCGQLIE